MTQDAEEPRLVSFAADDLPRCWDQLGPLLERACDYTAEEITVQSVLSGMGIDDGVQRLHLLGVAKGSVLTSVMGVQVSMYPTKAGPWVRKLDCLFVSGRDVDEWLPFLPDLTAWAREAGCVSVRIPRARKGWLRVLPGWQRKSGDTCVMELEI